MVNEMIDNNIKYIREYMGLTQKELGNIFNVHESTISGWETAKDSIPLAKLNKLSNISNYSIDYILGLNKTNINYTKLEVLNKKEIGKNLKKLRTYLNLSQDKLSKSCNISQTAYSNYEQGVYLINTISLYSICKKYNKSMDKLLGKVETQELIKN